MFDRKRLLIRSAAVLLVALQQSVASYGYAQADDANETAVDEAAPETVVAIQGFGTPSAEAHVSEPST